MMALAHSPIGKRMKRRFPDHIQTERLHLRVPVLSDAKVVFDTYAQDPQVCRYMTWTPHESLTTVEVFFVACVEDWRTGERMSYVITERDNDRPIGMLDSRAADTKVEIGYVLARDYWGSGLMPEAIRGFVDAALSNIDTHRVQAVCDVDNIASQRALEKSGFSREGRLERYLVHPNVSSEPRACYMYARCR